MKGEHEDQRCPRKLQPTDKLTSFCTQKPNANSQRKVSLEQQEKGDIQLQPVPPPKPKPVLMLNIIK